VIGLLDVPVFLTLMLGPCPALPPTHSRTRHLNTAGTITPGRHRPSSAQLHGAGLLCLGSHERVPDVAHRTDHVLVLGAELGP
jgi:hypothetical protein